MDEVEVQVVDTEANEALLGLCGRVGAGRMKLRRDEDLRARHATLLESPTDACLVAVRLGSVDVSIAELECPANRVDAVRPVGNLPETKTKRGNLTSVREYSHAVCLWFRCVRQRSSFGGESHWSVSLTSLRRRIRLRVDPMACLIRTFIAVKGGRRHRP
jgi:hypothetical protein